MEERKFNIIETNEDFFKEEERLQKELEEGKTVMELMREEDEKGNNPLGAFLSAVRTNRF